MLTVLFWVVEFVIMAVLVLPLLRFLLQGWRVRYEEFTNKFANPFEADLYFRRFWPVNARQPDASKQEQFDNFYRSLVGRRLYMMPSILLFIITFILSGLVVSTAIRYGNTEYVLKYEQWFKAAELPKPPHLLTWFKVTELPKPSLPLTELVFAPFPQVMVSMPALAAIAGAYLFVVSAGIQASRTRDLVPSDLFWNSARLVISVPMGLSLMTLSNDVIGPFIAFGLGALPLEQINRLIRRLMYLKLNQTEQEGDTDQLLQLTGVTPQVSAVLNGEGINAVQQLSDTDPVSLTVRSGLPFEYVIFLVAQSLVWCYIGSSARKLVPYGLGDCRAIFALVQRYSQNQADPQVDAVLSGAASAVGIPRPAIESVFSLIAADEYTRFLVQFAP